MFKFTKVAVAVTTCLALTACLEVEDNSNDALVEELRAQNEILQNQQKAEQGLVSLYGQIVTAGSADGMAATIKVKAGSTWYPEVTTTDGHFTVPQLPPYTEFVVVITGESNYLERAYYGRTLNAGANQSFQQALGQIELYEAEEFTFKVADEQSGELLTNATVSADISVNADAHSLFAELNSYKQEATVNPDTGLYTILAAKGFGLVLEFNLDLDKDGIADHALANPMDPYYPGRNKVRFDSVNLDKEQTIYTNEKAGLRELEIRVSVLNDDLESLNDLDFFVNTTDSTNSARENFVFDTDTQQYVAVAKSSNYFSITLPAFIANGINYKSLRTSLDLQDDGFYRVYSNYHNSYDVYEKDGVVDIVIKPEINFNISTLSVVAKTERLNYLTDSFKLFYSSPIELLSDSVLLSQVDKLSIIPGNAVADDSTPNGTTRVSFNEVEVEATSNLGLNDTFLTVTPSAPMIAGEEYKLSLGYINDAIFNVRKDLAQDDFSLKAPSQAVFSIDDVFVDNFNYSTNGQLTHATNTAGEMGFSHGENPIRFVFPKSIDSLYNLTMTITESTRNGVKSAQSESYTPVHDGSPYGLEKAITLASSSAENIFVDRSEQNQYFHVYSGTAENYAKSYLEYIHSIRLNDHTSSSENSIKVTYSYNLAGGEEVTGEKVFLIR
ncbi:hypothetical protein [Psychrobium sp. 1_MG-2023]|uniref:hypothetical protein n=1 Tax=Psychrobium sp. 1_MG-2023 TaxID=3062624 RepID=UPI000C33885C|nr:hypothetical protein [Psychrobium sp. 1_MG-2023]MDP2561898.1 hypothetical protein [Psychrobium sp. 1_MG-2023]PKF59686.1 hypothetical protein CW748_00340 [Alteromonadales bacterium alter-6D02]